MGNYQPLPYILPGLATRIASDPLSGNYLGRLASALPTIALLGLGIAVAFRTGTGGMSILGPLIALTPMVLFLGSTLTPSALEISAGFAFASAMVRIGLDRQAPRMAYVIGGVSGVLLALSRSTGPVWVLLLALIPLSLRGAQDAWDAIRRASPVSWVALGSIAVAATANRIWEAAFGPDFHISLSPVGHSLSEGLGWTALTVSEQIGVFGYLELSMPRVAYLTWYAMLATLSVVALMVGQRRQRLVYLSIAAASIAIPTLLQAAIIRHTGFYVSGRHVLPFTVALPLLAAGIVASNRSRLAGLATSVPLWFATAAGLVHLLGWLANARRHAVGANGPLFFFGHSQWAPPLGWAPWLAVVTAGVSAIIAAGWLAIRERPPVDSVMTASSE